ncbi:Retrovirus-related Pol polyprotein from transposon 17.6, partial [Mucuna pruriens]
MISIFSNLLEDYMEVFIDDYTVYVESFEAWLDNLSRVLRKCINNNLVLNFEKCQFMVTKGIVLDTLFQVEVLKSTRRKSTLSLLYLTPPLCGRFALFLDIKITLPLSMLLQKDVELKKRLTFAPILQAPNWEYLFELMCDVSNSALGAILGQRVGKQSHVNYTTTEKELLAIIFALDKFRSYLLGSKIIVFFDHSTLKFLLKKPNAKPRLI